MAKIILAVAACVAAFPAEASTLAFRFGRDFGDLGGSTAGSVAAGSATLEVAASPAGALLDDRSAGGLGVNSRVLDGVVGGEVDKFDVIEGPGPLAGQGEAVVLSLDAPSVLTGVDFDGVKDESLEYFILTTASGARVNFFDSAANTTVTGAVDAAVTAGALSGDVVYLLEGGGLDDETAGLSIPLAAGESFTITYAELGPAFGPTDTPNGARLQGITFQVVPEPSALSLVGVIAGLSAWRRRCPPRR